MSNHEIFSGFSEEQQELRGGILCGSTAQNTPTLRLYALTQNFCQNWKFAS